MSFGRRTGRQQLFHVVYWYPNFLGDLLRAQYLCAERSLGTSFGNGGLANERLPKLGKMKWWEWQKLIWE